MPTPMKTVVITPQKGAARETMLDAVMRPKGSSRHRPIPIHYG
jgi:hypothetical protein